MQRAPALPQTMALPALGPLCQTLLSTCSIPCTPSGRLLTAPHLSLPTVPLSAVMTYDYSSAQQPGPNAPLPWVQQNADAFAAAADRWAGLSLASTGA